MLIIPQSLCWFWRMLMGFFKVWNGRPSLPPSGPCGFWFGWRNAPKLGCFRPCHHQLLFSCTLPCSRFGIPLPGVWRAGYPNKMNPGLTTTLVDSFSLKRESLTFSGNTSLFIHQVCQSGVNIKGPLPLDFPCILIPRGIMYGEGLKPVGV